MKAAKAILALLPAAVATDTCVAECGCAGCGEVASVPFVQKGSELIATAAGWATMALSDSTIAIENLSGSTLTVNIYGVVCYYISPHSSCTVKEPDNFTTAPGMLVWQHP